MGPTPETLRARAVDADRDAALHLSLSTDYRANASALRDRTDRLKRIPKFLRPLLRRFIR